MTETNKRNEGQAAIAVVRHRKSRAYKNVLVEATNNPFDAYDRYDITQVRKRCIAYLRSEQCCLDAGWMEERIRAAIDLEDPLWVDLLDCYAQRAREIFNPGYSIRALNFAADIALSHEPGFADSIKIILKTVEKFPKLYWYVTKMDRLLSVAIGKLSAGLDEEHKDAVFEYDMPSWHNARRCMEMMHHAKDVYSVFLLHEVQKAWQEPRRVKLKGDTDGVRHVQHVAYVDQIERILAEAKHDQGVDWYTSLLPLREFLKAAGGFTQDIMVWLTFEKDIPFARAAEMVKTSTPGVSDGTSGFKVLVQFGFDGMIGTVAEEDERRLKKCVDRIRIYASGGGCDKTFQMFVGPLGFEITLRPSLGRNRVAVGFSEQGSGTPIALATCYFFLDYE